jgi:hypothetical protein
MGMVIKEAAGGKALLNEVKRIFRAKLFGPFAGRRASPAPNFCPSPRMLEMKITYSVEYVTSVESFG